MPVLPDLRHQDPRLAALGRGELVHQLARPFDRRVPAGLVRVHTRDDPDLAGVTREHLLQRVGDLPGANWRTSLAPSSRAARSFATSMKKFMPMPKKNDNRANAPIPSPASMPARTYSIRQALNRLDEGSPKPD